MFSTMLAMHPAVQALLDLFSTSLADVRFADVDGPSLARSAAEVDALAPGGSRCPLRAGRGEFGLARETGALLQRARRALAYARVYADSDTTLTASLEAIGLPRAARRATVGDAPFLSAASDTAPRPRGRPRKRAAAETTLEMSMPGAE